ncbi:cytochrome p450 family protein [Colletotrichum sojae]|uniref:Cytochrome p450 family protein n=1 Tax=Colletotrichum sojae TaxID=2175907 RepID=A0A8H6MPV4_9PEZI|nr:cytochrome p450 family protein [Colletotrichum sojae]
MTTNCIVEFAAENPVLVGLIALLPLLMILLRPDSNDPPSMPEAIPFVTNAYHFMTDTKSFTKRANDAMKSSNVVQLRLGPVRMYLIKGGQQIQTMFRKSASISSDKFVVMVMRNLQGSSPRDVERFAADLSGRAVAPAPGFEHVPQAERHWYWLHHITTTRLARAEDTARLAGSYDRFFGECLEKQPQGEWGSVRLFDMLRRDMAASGINSLCGTRLLEAHPGFVEQFWRFDDVAYQCMYGLPKWIAPKPVEERDKLRQMAWDYLEEVLPTYDWAAAEADGTWEPKLGSAYMRDLQKYLNGVDAAMQTRSGFMIIAIFGQDRTNSNTIPITAWIMMELLKDPSLMSAVRLEANSAIVVDSDTGARHFDAQKLVSMTLFQSVYVECMRLHVSMGIMREVIEDTVLDGYRLRKGSFIQAPTNIMHQDEEIWGRKGHAASEFWAERHVRDVEREDGTTEKTFVLAGKPSEFFPFGGGVSMCPGRHFAKQEILLTVAMLVTRFEIEVVEWTHMDGTKSDRQPQDNEKYFGNAAVPPDRDVKVRWKRLW